MSTTVKRADHIDNDILLCTLDHMEKALKKIADYNSNSYQGFVAWKTLAEIRATMPAEAPAPEPPPKPDDGMWHVFSYRLHTVAEQTISMPKDAEILSVSSVDGHLLVHALVDAALPVEDRRFAMAGDCERLKHSALAHVATVHHNDSILHVFEDLTEAPF